MGVCCSCFNIRDTVEDINASQRQTRNRIGFLWHKVSSVRNNERSDAPASTSEVTAPLNSNAASNNLQSNDIITVADKIYSREDEGGHMELVSKGNKSTGLQGESQLKLSYEKLEAQVYCSYGSSENEDVCPTCLEEYIPENPRIVLQCNHSYHLSCIYEWMERSANCPICGKMMVFNEEA